MGMDINETGRDNSTAGIDGFGGIGGSVAHSDDTPVLYT
jgi:lactate dehydrogenase-like 2-hydroxyacid dehydrogenase